MPITGKILEVAQAHPERLAIVGAEARITYGELAEDGRRVRAVVEHLQDAARPRNARLRSGALPGNAESPSAQPPVGAAMAAEPSEHPAASFDSSAQPVVAVSSTDAFHTARIIAGLAGFDCVAATIDPRWPLEHQVRVVLGTGMSVLVSDSDALRDALARAGWAGAQVSLEEFRRLERELPPAEAPSVRPGDEPFLMLFSSGTTSNPKAFLKTRAQYRANFAVSSAHLEPLPGVATLAPGPLSYSLTLYALVECLASGGSCHVADSFDALAASRRIFDEGVTRIVAVPAVIESLALVARRSPERLSGVELLVAGGANLSARIRSAVAESLPHARLVSYYGAAEIGFIGDSRGGDGTAITLYDGIAAEVRGPLGEVLADGEIGELWIRADACSDGYLPATTDEQLRDGEGWATVHDQARLRGRQLELLGRAGDIVVTGGHKVSLPEVERAFELLPGADAVCAVSAPDASLGSIIALVLEGADAPDKATVLAFARERLAPQFVPRRVYRVGALPRTVGGKVRRAATAELVAHGEAVRL